MSARLKIVIVFSLLIISALAVYALTKGMGMSGGRMGGGVTDQDQINSWLRGETLRVDLDSPRPPENEATIRAGRMLYGMRCAVCHGLKGDGKGEKAADLQVKPRDFTYGTYKFRSTPNVFPPTDEDIFKTISRGLHGTSMLPWTQLTSGQKWLVTFYIKTFSDVFEEEELEIVKAPELVRTAGEYIERGKGVYEKAKCADCHGREGDGNGEKADKLKDDRGRPIRPRNFREQILKRGLNVEDIYLTIATGLYGTPMESYSDKLKEDEIMALAYYIQSLAPERRSGRIESINPDVQIGMELIMMQSSVFGKNKGEILLVAGIVTLGLIFFFRRRRLNLQG